MIKSFTFRIDEKLLRDFKDFADKKFISISDLLRQYMLSEISKKAILNKHQKINKATPEKILTLQQIIDKYIDGIKGKFNLHSDSDGIRIILELLQFQCFGEKLSTMCDRKRRFNENTFKEELNNHINKHQQ